ncbi:MAG: hypothetical protein K0R00_4413 [Herbinix sp.]|jgi:hypothetical protein|nr:hypothetical protein [Herbinix sp.]
MGQASEPSKFLDFSHVPRKNFSSGLYKGRIPIEELISTFQSFLRDSKWLYTVEDETVLLR